MHASSGTTGKPTVVGYTAADIDTWASLMARSIRAAGGRPGDIVHVAYGYGLFTGGLGAHYGAEKLGCTVVPMSGGQTEKQVQLIVDFKPDVIMLDNFTVEDLRRAVAIVGGQVVLEASGGVDLTTVRAIAETGVDLISVGALTHSAPVLDIGLDAA